MVYSAWWCSWSNNSRATRVKTIGPTFNSCTENGGVSRTVSLLKTSLWTLPGRALQDEMMVLHWNWTTVRWCLRDVTFFEVLCLDNLSPSLCVARRCCCKSLVVLALFVFLLILMTSLLKSGHNSKFSKSGRNCKFFMKGRNCIFLRGVATASY